MSRSSKQRLDEILVNRRLADSRAQARALIIARKVRSGNDVLDKPGKSYPADMPLEVQHPPLYVGRGAEKLLGYLNAYPMDVKGMHILDVGASTGGFTDLLLQRGAIHASCVDVGRGQLHNKLVQDERVLNLEKTNARHLKPGDLPHNEYPLIVMDLSFISLRLIIPAVWPFLSPGGRMIALIKPQFEATKTEVDHGQGIIRDDNVRERVLEEIRAFVLKEFPDSREVGFIESPISGADGNREYLAGWDKAEEFSETGVPSQCSLLY